VLKQSTPETGKAARTARKPKEAKSKGRKM
jgi:hypothetical protein